MVISPLRNLLLRVSCYTFQSFFYIKGSGMAGSISGVGAQQASLAQSLQSNNVDQQDRAARNGEEQQKAAEQGSKVQTRGAAASQADEIEAARNKRKDEDDKAQNRAQQTASNSNQNQNTTQRRGSLVDVVV